MELGKKYYIISKDAFVGGKLCYIDARRLQLNEYSYCALKEHNSIPVKLCSNEKSSFEKFVVDHQDIIHVIECE